MAGAPAAGGALALPAAMLTAMAAFLCLPQVDSSLSRLKILQVTAGAAAAAAAAAGATGAGAGAAAAASGLQVRIQLGSIRLLLQWSQPLPLQERIVNTEHLVNLDLDAKRNALVRGREAARWHRCQERTACTRSQPKKAHPCACPACRRPPSADAHGTSPALAPALAVGAVPGSGL